MTEKQRVLLTEKEKNLVRLYRMYLEEAGYTVATALSGEEGLEKWRDFRSDMITTSMALNTNYIALEIAGKMDGFQYAMTLRERGYSGPIAAITSGYVEDYAHKHGVSESEINKYITKRLPKTGVREEFLAGISSVLQ